jgi:hypothetical protein
MAKDEQYANLSHRNLAVTAADKCIRMPVNMVPTYLKI